MADSIRPRLYNRALRRRKYRLYLTISDYQAPLNAANAAPGDNAANPAPGDNAANPAPGDNAANPAPGDNAANVVPGDNAANTASGDNAANAGAPANAVNAAPGTAVAPPAAAAAAAPPGPPGPAAPGPPTSYEWGFRIALPDLWGPTPGFRYVLRQTGQLWHVEEEWVDDARVGELLRARVLIGKVRRDPDPLRSLLRWMTVDPPLTIQDQNVRWARDVLNQLPSLRASRSMSTLFTNWPVIRDGGLRFVEWCRVHGVYASPTARRPILPLV